MHLGGLDMGLTKYKFGELIELTNEKNANGLYGEDDAIGVNIDKIIMPMRGNLEKKDFSNFHLVPPRHFAYNPRGSRKLGIGFNDTEKTFIITFNDNVFRIKETAKKKILDTYLFMYLCRKEWDRYAEFISWGSSTEVFDWNIFCEEEIFLPPIQIQQKYVDVYNAMLENQKSYERGLDDLKLVCDAYIY
jgi:type I restriction enzyme S subunit